MILNRKYIHWTYRQINNFYTLNISSTYRQINNFIHTKYVFKFFFLYNFERHKIEKKDRSQDRKKISRLINSFQIKIVPRNLLESKKKTSAKTASTDRIHSRCAISPAVVHFFNIELQTEL